MEPITTTTTSGYIISKGAAALAGLFGGLSVSFFWQPKRLHQHGKMAAGAIIGGISVASAFSLGGIVARLIGLDFNDVDTALGLGFSIGVLCVGFIAWVANFLEKREGSDILEVGQEIMHAAKNPGVVPTPKPWPPAPARKTVKRKPATKKAAAK